MKRRRFALVLVCLAITLCTTLVGPSLAGPQGDFVLYQLRIPRMLVGAFSGASLALAGACFQIIFNNPLATPSTVGTLAGATLGAIAALTFGIDREMLGMPLTTLAAFGGALLTSFAVIATGRRQRAKMADILLAGIAVSLAASAIATGVEYVADSRALFAASRWALGHVAQVGYRGVSVLAPVVLVTSVLLLAQARALRSFALGEEIAHAQGVNVRRLRIIVLLAASFAVAAIVAWCGPIAFVGLIVPHLVRLLVGPSVYSLLPLSAVAGAAFLTLCDALSRSIVPGRELPVGVLTAALGAPALIALIARSNR